MVKKIICILLTLTFLFTSKLNTIDVHDAWENYPSSETSDNTELVIKFDIEKLLKINNESLNQLLKERAEYLSLTANLIIKTNNTWKGYNQVGILFAKNSFFKDAINFFKISLTKKNDWSTYNNIANIYFLTRNDKLAIEYYKLALRLSKNNPVILLNLAFIYFDMGDFKKAKKYYLTATLIDPSIDCPEYAIIAGEEKANETKADNIGVKKIQLKWK